MSLPQFFPDCTAALEYISSWEGMRLTATRLPSDFIQIITSGTLFWGCTDNDYNNYTTATLLFLCNLLDYYFRIAAMFLDYAQD